MTTYQEESFPIPTPGRLVRELRLKRPPWWMVVTLLVVVIAAWVPLAMIYEARKTKSRQPRIHFFLDMDKQARFGPQSSHPWFVDGRAMRLPVEGTIFRGGLMHDQHYALGYLTTDGTPHGAVTEFVKSLPPQLSNEVDALTERGRNRFSVYCATCHGTVGSGDGPTHNRAIELKETKWVPATNLLTQLIRDRADGQLFQAITDGVRNMPSYGSQIPPRDRWAIVAYVRQLQRTQPVAPEPVTPPATPPPPPAATPGAFNNAPAVLPAAPSK